MRTAALHFLSSAEAITVKNYTNKSPLASEFFARLIAGVLLSPAAALDIVYHSSMILPTCSFAIGKSIFKRRSDFTLPWQHIQRVRNSIAPLFLGSVFGLIHPLAGIVMCEPTDKHAVLGMLSSNTKQSFDTPCSPIHSLSIVKNIAKKHIFCKSNEVKKEIFSREHLKAIREANNFEKTLESLQAQEFVHKITNLTLFVMAIIKGSIEDSNLNDLSKGVLIRSSGLLIPILASVDLSVALLAQAFFLATGIVRLISGRGPIYTEVTTNPLMHASFLIQNLLKTVGCLVGACVWFISPMDGFKVSLLPANWFFKMQMNLLMLKIRIKMHFAKDGTRFVIPIVFGNGVCEAFSVPSHSMHKTYLIVEKKAGLFNLYWVNRPDISTIQKLDAKATLKQIRSMIDERFPFMDLKKVMNYPVESNQPGFLNAVPFAKIAEQGSPTNCVVSNLFGMLEALDKIKGDDEEVTSLRYKVVREALVKDYGFYKNKFYPFANESEGFSLRSIWNNCLEYPLAAI